RAERELRRHEVQCEGAEEEVVLSAVEAEAAGEAARAQPEPGLERIARVAVGAPPAHPPPEEQPEPAGAEVARGEADRGDDVMGVRAHALIYPDPAGRCRRSGATSRRGRAGPTPSARSAAAARDGPRRRRRPRPGRGAEDVAVIELPSAKPGARQGAGGGGGGRQGAPASRDPLPSIRPCRKPDGNRINADTA